MIAARVAIRRRYPGRPVPLVRLLVTKFTARSASHAATHAELR